MATKLYIGGISYNTNEQALKDHFSQIGPVASAVIITDKFSGRSRGFGFVEYENDGDAQKAMTELDGKELDGRTLSVAKAQPMAERPARDFSGGGGFNRDRGGFNRNRGDSNSRNRW